MTSYVVENSYSIRNSIWSEVDTLNIELQDDTILGLNIRQGYDIIVEDAANENTRFFGGVIQTIQTVSRGVGISMRITAVDWTYVLDRTSVKKTYSTAGQTDQEILRSAIRGSTDGGEAGLTEFSTNDIRKGRTLDSFSFNGSSVRSILDQISTITGFIWYVTPWKEIIYKDRSLEAGYVNFDVSPDESLLRYGFEGLSVTRKLALWNTVEMESSGLSDNVTEIYSGDGSTTVFQTGDSQWSKGSHVIWRAPTTSNFPIVEKNTGSNGSPTWTTQSIKLEGAGGSASDAQWNPTTHTVTFTSAPPNFANSWRITGRFSTPTNAFVEDSVAVSSHGRVFKTSINAPKGSSVEQTTELANALLRENTDRILLRFNTNYDTPKAGTMCGITHPKFDLSNEQFLVTGVTTRIVGGEVFEHRVEGEIVNKELYA